MNIKEKLKNCFSKGLNWFLSTGIFQWFLSIWGKAFGLPKREGIAIFAFIIILNTFVCFECINFRYWENETWTIIHELFNCGSWIGLMGHILILYLIFANLYGAIKRLIRKSNTPDK